MLKYSCKKDIINIKKIVGRGNICRMKIKIFLYHISIMMPIK